MFIMLSFIKKKILTIFFTKIKEYEKSFTIYADDSDARLRCRAVVSAEHLDGG